MKLVRFMSAAEALDLLQGARVYNHTDHHKEGQGTNSIGFCFAIGGEFGIEQSQEIWEMSKRLSGVTVMQICLVAEIAEPLEDSKGFVLGWGRYRAGNLPEVSCEKYRLKDFIRWEMYTPHDLTGMLPPSSGNWVHPKLSVKGKR